MLVAHVCPTLCNPMDYNPPGPRLLCLWDSPGKNTEVGCHSLLQGIFPTQGSNPGLHCEQILHQLSHKGIFPGGSDSKASAYNAGDPGSIPWSGRSSGEGNGKPLQYSCLENSIDGGAWWAAVHGVTKSQTQLSNFTFTCFLESI